MYMQTKPIRSVAGADITQATLQTTLDTLGIDKAVSQLGYAEKRLLIVISLTDQLSEAINDMGNTIESPANQTRIFHEQWERLTRVVGQMFLPTLAKILPYVNAILMVLTEIIDYISRLLGFSEEEFDYINKTSDAFEGIAEGIDQATESSDNLNKSLSGLRKFDKLNVIKTPTESGGTGSVGGGVGGIDKRLLDAFDEAFENYNNKLDKIVTKATKIRDAIMKWLGFTKLIDEETDEISFKFEKFTGGTILGALAVGGTIYEGIRGILGFLNKIGVIDFNLPSLGSLLGTLFSSEALVTIGLIAGAVVILGFALKDLYKNNEEFAKSFDEKWEGLKTAIEPVEEKLKELFDVLGSDWNEGSVKVLKELFEELWSTVQILGAELLDFLYPIFIDIIIPALEGIIAVTTDVIKIFNKLWFEYGKPIFSALRTALEKTGEVLDYLWSEFVKPIIDKTTKILNDLWTNTLKPMFEKLGKAFGEISLLILNLYNYVLLPLVKWFISYFGPTIDTVVNAVLDIFHWFVKTIGGIINGLLDIFNGIIETINGVFAGDWEKALNGLILIGKGVFNTFASIVEGIINGIITGLNKAIKNIYNGIKKMVNKIGGVVNAIAKAVGIDLNVSMSGSAPSIDLVTLPRLEKGMDFVPKDYFGPVYLDYGERVLTKQENRDFTANKKASQQVTQSQPQIYNIYVGSEKVTQVVYDGLKDMARTNGKPIEIRG